MKKLRLESIEVTSFETSDATPARAGTVRGRQQEVAAALASYPRNCPTDPNLDCTYGCSWNTACPENCVRLTDSIDCL